MNISDFVFMVFADEPFTSLGVPEIDIPIPTSVAAAMSKAATSGHDLPLDLPTLHDFVTVCCRQHPELATRCLPARCCLAFLFGRQAVNACGQMLNSGRNLNDHSFITEYSAQVSRAHEHLLLACRLSDEWAKAPLFLKHNCHWYMARVYMLAHSEEDAIVELEKVITICGSTDLVPDVWLALAGILSSKNQEDRATHLLEDYVLRTNTIFPERAIEFLDYGKSSAYSKQYPFIKRYFDGIQK